MTLFTTPTGRLVYGHPSVKVQKRDQKKQPVFKDGQPVMIRMFGVAFAKADFNAFIWPVFSAAAMAAYNGQNPPPHFAWKFKDGDSIDRAGKPYAQREGYAGHCVVHFETQFDINAYKQGAGGGWEQITDKDYKTGDYIAVSVDVTGNKPSDPTHTPGLYVNPQGVLLIGHGQAIVNAPSADQMFAGQQFALPPGATAPGAMPAAPAGMPAAPGMAPMPGYPQAAPPQQPMPGGYQPGTAPDFVNNAVQGGLPPGAVPGYPYQR